MGIYDRNKNVPGREANWWISYSIDGVQQREPAGADRREAERLLRRRRREIAEGTWQPPGGVSGSNVPRLEAYAERWLAERRTAGVKTVNDEETRLRRYVLPHLGMKHLDEIRRSDVKALVVQVQGLVSEETGRALAPRSIHHVYGTLRALFGDAVADELIATSPCTLRVRKGELPKKRDADPTWRQGAVYTRGEIVTLLSDERVPEDRRAFYGLLFLTGMRFGEAAGRRWRDYERDLEPLGKLVVPTQYDDAVLKTEVPREVPVHATLAAILAAWRDDGFARFFGHPPKPEDWIVPSRMGAFRSLRHMHRKLQEDCERLGLRTRGLHDTRRSFISLARADGASRDVLKAITHDGQGDVFDGYTIWPWATLCEAVARFRLELPQPRRRSDVVDLSAITPSITPGPENEESLVKHEAFGAGWTGLEGVEGVSSNQATALGFP